MTTAERDTQRKAALKKGNKMRTHMADLKAEIKTMNKHDGLLHVAVLLERPSDAVMKSKVGALLEAVKFFGPTKTTAELRRPEVGTYYDCRVGRMTVRQRLVLAQRIRELAS